MNKFFQSRIRRKGEKWRIRPVRRSRVGSCSAGSKYLPSLSWQNNGFNFTLLSHCFHTITPKSRAIKYSLLYYYYHRQLDK